VEVELSTRKKNDVQLKRLRKKKKKKRTGYGNRVAQKRIYDIISKQMQFMPRKTPG